MSQTRVNTLTAVGLGIPDWEAAASFYENVWGYADSPSDRFFLAL